MNFIFSKTVNFKLLESISDFPCISIFLDNDSVWPQNETMAIALKNQVKKMTSELQEHGLSKAECQQMFQPMDQFAKESTFWKKISKSLTIFMSPNKFLVYEVDLKLKDSYHIGHFFDIKALIPLKHFKPFFLLTISQEKTALYFIHSGRHRKIRLKDMPSSFSEFLKFDEIEKSHQNYSYKNPMGSHSMHHGQGMPKDFLKIRLEQYADCIAKEVYKYTVLKKQDTIAVGLPPLASFFRKHISTQIVELIEKDPNSLPLSELIDKVRTLHMKKDQLEIDAETKKSLSSKKSRDKLEHKISDIVKRAQEGRIKKLLIKKDEYIWGQFSDTAQEVKTSKEKDLHGEDLLNLAAIYTLKNGGEVFEFDSAMAPKISQPAFALLRD